MKSEKKQDDLFHLRKKMVEKLKEKGTIHSPSVTHAFLTIPREKFVLEKYQREAYEDIALPFAPEQTISQPTTIAIMLELLNAQKGMRVLEAGSGCGYVLALLSCIVGSEGKVCGIEYDEKSVNESRKRLQELKAEGLEIFDIDIRAGDGKKGWAGEKTFDRVLVSAARTRLPLALQKSIAEGGKAVAPIGGIHTQELQVFQRINGKILVETYPHGLFTFVPLHD